MFFKYVDHNVVLSRAIHFTCDCFKFCKSFLFACRSCSLTSMSSNQFYSLKIKKQSNT